MCFTSVLLGKKIVLIISSTSIHADKQISLLHEVCGVGRPIGSIFGPHFQSLFPQLSPERVLETTKNKHDPIHEPVEWDLLHTRGFGFLLFGGLFRFWQALPLLLSRLLSRGC